MRKFLISAAFIGSTMVVAAPAAAQWAPQQGYGQGYGYNDRGNVRSLQMRINRLERQIAQLDRRNILSDREARRLRNEANVVERQLRQASYNGLNNYERRSIELRMAHLEQNIRRQANDGNRYSSRNNGYGNAYDRDRDGRDDRYEDDRGTRHD